MKNSIINNQIGILGLRFFTILILLASCKTQKHTINTYEEKGVACTYMRGGTSKGPFFDMRDLPRDPKLRDKILLKVMGSPDPNQIDGLGGTITVASKVVLAEPSKRKGIDVDYLFAQVDIENPIVDTMPPCGNMMAGVGPFAIEKGWVKATHPETKVLIYNINTKSVIEEIIQTPNGKVQYEGTTAIDGVKGTASPIVMNLFDQVGGKTGKLLPTDKLKDTILGVETTLMDAGMLMVLIKAKDLGIKGDENAEFFEKSLDLMAKIEQIRLEAGHRMGLGDVKNSVLPKVGILSSPKNGSNNIQSRYLTPHTLHVAHAVTGAICVGTALKIKGTVAADVGKTSNEMLEKVIIEHPSGVIEVVLTMENINNKLTLKKAGTIRTVRKIMEGKVFF
jgi:hypothetical protein